MVDKLFAKNPARAICTAVLCAWASCALTEGLPVNLLTVVPAESELMFNNAIERAGGVNRWDHARQPANQQTQRIVRTQSDMLYSHGVFDAAQGLTISVPEQLTGYHSVHVFDANHGQLAVVYSGQTHTIEPGDISTGSKHVYAMMRTATDRGLDAAHRAQDGVEMIAESGEDYVGPGYDPEQLAFAKRFMVGAAIGGLVSSTTAWSSELKAGTVVVEKADPAQRYNYIFSAVLGWGLMPSEHAYYPQLMVPEGKCPKVSFRKPPVQYDNGGYWSFTAYGTDGYLRTDNAVVSAYKAKANDDGTYTISVGSPAQCPGALNRVDMPEGGASVTLRMYRPTSIDAAKVFEREIQR